MVRAMRCNATLLSNRRKEALLLLRSIAPFSIFAYSYFSLHNATENTVSSLSACTRMGLTSMLKLLRSSSQLP